jgi:hypothetical protein
LVGGAEVVVRGGAPVLRILAPIPALWRGFPLHPDAADDPYAFRLDLSTLGMTTVRVVFGRDPMGGVTGAHVDLGGQPLTLVKHAGQRGDARPKAVLGALALAGLVTAIRRRERRRARGIETNG